MGYLEMRRLHNKPTVFIIIIVIVFLVGVFVVKSTFNRVLEFFQGRNKIEKTPSISLSTEPNIMFDKIMNALDAKDGEELKTLFSPNLLSRVPEIDNQIIYLINFYKGNSVSKGNIGTPGGEDELYDGTYLYLTIDTLPIEVKTDQAVYSVQFSSVAVNDRDTNDVGLWYLLLTDENGEECSVGTWYEGRESLLNTNKKL